MYYYILNPASGRGAVNQIEDRLRQKLNEAGIGGEFAKTTGPGDAAKMTLSAISKGYNTIVAVGGDSTVNEVINGIKKDNVAVGIVPVGKLNHLAARLGIFDWEQAVPILAQRRLITYNLMAAGQHYFLSSLSIGFPADWDKKVEEAGGVTARFRQLRQTFQHTREWEELKCQIQADENLAVSSKVFYLWITNQKFQNPQAANKLVVSFSDRPGRRQLSSLIWRLISSRTADEEVYTSRFLANRVLIDTKPQAGVMIDGKLSGRTPVAVRLTEKRIRFICGKDMPFATQDIKGK